MRDGATRAALYVWRVMYGGAERGSAILDVDSENRRLSVGRESLLRPCDGSAVQAANVAVAERLKDEHA